MSSALKFLIISIVSALVLFVLPRPVYESLGIHYSLNGTQEFFEEAYKNIDPQKPKDKITGITVNHHLLAANLVAQEFSLVETNQPIPVVLISPNHFFRGEGRIITSRYDWQTPYGVLRTDQRLGDKLQTAGAKA